MIKGKYNIRKGSIAYYAIKANENLHKAKKPLAVALMTTALFSGIVYATTETETETKEQPQEQIAIAYASSETKTKKQESFYKVIAYYEGNDEFYTEDGDLWYTDGLMFNKGDGAVLTITDYGTSDVDDDYVVDVERKSDTYDVPLSDEFQEYIISICEQYPSEINEVHLELVLAVIERESNYNPNAIGDNGEAFGLMQVQPKWHQARMDKLGVTDLLDPYQNVKVGIDYLAECLREYETLDEALTVYNAGAGGAEDLYFSKGILCSPYADDVLTNWREICLSICQ